MARHAETGVGEPSITWYLAEGSTSGDFSLFYLLQNPNPAPTTATIRYLLPFGQPPVERDVRRCRRTRARRFRSTTQGPALASTDVSAVITAALPIIVERAMYLEQPDQPFAAGHESAGVTAPATRAGSSPKAPPGRSSTCSSCSPIPNTQPASGDHRLPAARRHHTVRKSYTVPANGRFTVWVDDEEIPAGSGLRPLDNVAVSSTVTSSTCRSSSSGRCGGRVRR